ncbi:MAG TPA: alkaline phosphatase D family protein [Candidatus Obscuribacterales bacterium]
MNINRRNFLKGTASVLFGSLVSLPALARISFQADPFKLGVASGSPSPDGIVLWTRLAPNPLQGGGLGPHPVKVRWEIAADEGFHKIVSSGTAVASPRYAHSVHVEASGLQPARSYWYRFFAGDAVSPVGCTRTAPAPDSADPVRFAFASCQMYEQGYFTAHRHMAQEDLDLVVFLGDYIYEHSWGRNDVRKHEGPEVHTLDEYRNRYACYKSDPDLQRCHARFPWIVTWDDHEVDNDYANDRAEDLEQNFLLRRAAAYQAYYEHMPVRKSFAPHNANMRIYRAYDFGKMARFHVLDDRQYRDYQVFPKQGRAGSNIINDCPQRHDPKRTMLGWKQEEWLKKSLKDSSALWDVIVQQTLMSQVMMDGKYWTDGWDGYPAARRRLLEAATRRSSSDTIVVGGDVHCYAVCDLKLDFADPHSPTVASEFCGTSISSQGFPNKQTNAWVKENPHIHYANGEARGYTKVALGKSKAKVSLRSIESEKIPDANIRTLAQYVVQKGRPGPQAV